MFDFSITKKEIKGIDFAVKAISKKYNFIKNWKLSKDYYRYQYTIFIDLYVDFDLLSEYSGYGFEPYWKNVLDKSPKNMGGSSSFYSYFSPNNDEKKIIDSVDLKEEILNKLNFLYQNLPDEFVAKTNSERNPLEPLFPRNINIDSIYPIQTFIK